MNTNIKERKSNFELLRIVAMFLIVSHHFAIHCVFSQWTLNTNIITVINSFLTVAIGSYGKIGVFLFIILMGYFNCDKKFKIEKFFNIYIKTFLYSLTIFFIISLFKTNLEFKNVLPMTKGSYWFINNYLTLYLISPLINKIILLINKNKLKIITILFTLINFIPPLINSHLNLGHISVFICLYLIGACYKKDIFQIKDIYLNLITLISLFFVFIYFILTIHYGEINFSKTQIHINMYSINTLIIACWIFNYFSKLNLKNSLINKIAASTFGIYLIHDNIFLRPFIWKSINIEHIIMSKFFFIESILIILAIFIVCIYLDIIFQFIYRNLITTISNSLGKFTKSILTYIKSYYIKS